MGRWGWEVGAGLRPESCRLGLVACGLGEAGTVGRREVGTEGPGEGIWSAAAARPLCPEEAKMAVLRGHQGFA